MPVTPTTVSSIAAIVTALDAVQGTGIVQARPRWAFREEKFIELFFYPVEGKINHLSVESRSGVDAEMPERFRWISQVDYVIRWLLGFNDEENSYETKDTVVDRIRSAFHSNASVFDTPELSQRGITAWSSDLIFGGTPSGSEILVHATEMVLTVEQIEAITV